MVFEAVPPFRGVRVRSRQPMLDRSGARQVRAEIAARYLGEERGKRFAAERASPGILLRLPWEGAKTRDSRPSCRANHLAGTPSPSWGPSACAAPRRAVVGLTVPLPRWSAVRVRNNYLNPALTRADERTHRGGRIGPSGGGW